MLSTQINITDPTALDILRGAAELFMRYGVKSITMDEIARHLSISKKTIYQHFADKDELVITFAHLILEQQKAEISQLETNASNTMLGLCNSSDFIKNKVCNINPSLLFDLKKYFPKAWKIFQEYKRNFLKDHFKRIFEKGIKEGYFREDINIEIIARLRIEQVELAFNPEVFPENEFDISEVHMQCFRHFVLGLCTIRGHEEFEKHFNTNKE